MNFGAFAELALNWSFLSSLLSIVAIDLLLAGDNAVVIAMAVKDLPPEQRRKGIILGAGAAVVLRVFLTFFISKLLLVSFLKLAGGVVIIWIGVKLLVDGSPEHKADKEISSVWQVVQIILIADITMSTDNMLAVAGASHGSLFLLIFGLALSIPFIVFTSNLLSVLMDRYPAVLYLGAAILGRVGGEMIITDPVVVDLLAPTKFLEYGTQLLCALLVLAASRLWLWWSVCPGNVRRACKVVDVSMEPDRGNE